MAGATCSPFDRTSASLSLSVRVPAGGASTQVLQQEPELSTLSKIFSLAEKSRQPVAVNGSDAAAAFNQDWVAAAGSEDSCVRGRFAVMRNESWHNSASRT